MFGYGPQNATIAVVGESPAATEVNVGKPFQGSSGHLLKQVMPQLGIDPESVYYTNALLCNYKTEDKPAKDTVEACHPRLLWELGKQNMPNLRVIIAVGGYALQALTGRTAITKAIYNVYWHDQLQAFVVPTYHPAFCFRNVEAFDDLVWAFERAQELVDKDKSVLDLPPVNLRIAKTHSEAYSLLWELSEINKPTWCAIDCESDNADAISTPMLAIGFCVKPGEAIIIPWAPKAPDQRASTDLVPDNGMLSLLARVFRNKNLKFVFHNGDFDARLIYYNTGLLCRIDYDTLLSDYALDERGGGDELEGTSGGTRVGSHRLKSAAKRYLGAPDWEGDIKQYLKNSKVPYSHIPRPRLYTYLGYDVHFTHLLRSKHEELLLAQEPSRKGYWTPHDCVHQLMIPAQNEITRMEIEGIWINRAKALDILLDMEAKLDELSVKIRERVLALGWPADKIDDFNIRSPLDLQTLIYTLMGVKVNKDLRTKLTGAPIDTEFPTGKDTLTKLRDRDPVIGYILDFKSIDKRRGTYIESIIEQSAVDGRVHGEFTLTVTRTGRLSSRNPNLQNIEPSTKELYEPETDEPSFFLNGDYKQLEVRVAAIYSRDPKLIQACQGDIHGVIAREIFAKVYADIDNAYSIDQLLALGTKHPIVFPMLQKIVARGTNELGKFKDELRDEVRNAAKPIIFGVIYGREAFSLANGPLQCSPKEAQKYIDNLFTRFNKLAAWLEEQKQDVLNYGWIESFTGRRRRFSFMNDEFINKILKQTTNAPVQGGASDVCVKAFIKIAPQLRDNGWGSVKLLVHDAIGASIKTRFRKEAIGLFKYEMENAYTDPEVVLAVDFKEGPNYGTLTKVKDF